MEVGPRGRGIGSTLKALVGEGPKEKERGGWTWRGTVTGQELVVVLFVLGWGENGMGSTRGQVVGSFEGNHVSGCTGRRKQRWEEGRMGGLDFVRGKNTAAEGEGVGGEARA